MKNVYAENPGKVSIASLKFEYLYIYISYIIYYFISLFINFSFNLFHHYFENNNVGTKS